MIHFWERLRPKQTAEPYKQQFFYFFNFIFILAGCNGFFLRYTLVLEQSRSYSINKMTAPNEQCIEDLQYWTRLRNAGFHSVLQFKVGKVCHFGRILAEGKKNV